MKSFYIAAPNKLILNQKTRTLNTTIVPSMNVGAWGDPHIYVKAPKSLDPNNYGNGRFLAKFGDNSSNNELLLLDLETVKHNIQIYYTNKNFGQARAVDSLRVVSNGISTAYNDTAYITIGPVTISLAKLGTGANAYMNFELKWSNMKAIKFNGAINLILKKISANNGFYNGLDGSTWDGFSYSGASYGVNRSTFETNTIQNLSISDSISIQNDVNLSDEEFNFLSSLADTVSSSSVIDGLDDNNTNEVVSVWDPTVDGDPEQGIDSSLSVFETYGTIDHYLANLVVTGTPIIGMPNNIANNIINNFIDNEISNNDGYSGYMSANIDTRLNNIIP